MIAERLEQALTRWIEHGRGDQELLQDWEYLRVYCWLYSKSGARYLTNPDVQAYFKASQAHFGQTGYIHLLQQRSSCAICKTPYHIENLSICTECDNGYCYRCSHETFPRNEYGDLQCACGGVIVG